MFFSIFPTNTCSISAERFFHAAHGSSAPRASSATGGKCPFRAAMQAKANPHTPSPSPPRPMATTAFSTTSAPSVAVKEAKEERSEETTECKCVADGLKPSGRCSHPTYPGSTQYL